jgi:hypothetical protein
MGLFYYFCPKIFPSNNDETQDEKNKQEEKVKKERIRILPFVWKYKIACDTKDTLQTNLKQTEDITKKCEVLHDSAKTYQQLTKQLSEKYKQ